MFLTSRWERGFHGNAAVEAFVIRKWAWIHKKNQKQSLFMNNKRQNKNKYIQMIRHFQMHESCIQKQQSMTQTGDRCGWNKRPAHVESDWSTANQSIQINNKQ